MLPCIIEGFISRLRFIEFKMPMEIQRYRWSDYSSSLAGMEVSSLIDATFLLALDDCDDGLLWLSLAELASLLSVPPFIPPKQYLYYHKENPNHQ